MQGCAKNGAGSQSSNSRQFSNAVQSRFLKQPELLHTYEYVVLSRADPGPAAKKHRARYLRHNAPSQRSGLLSLGVMDTETSLTRAPRSTLGRLTQKTLASFKLKNSKAHDALQRVGWEDVAVANRLCFSSFSVSHKEGRILLSSFHSPAKCSLSSLS